MSLPLASLLDNVVELLKTLPGIEDRVWLGGVEQPVPTDLRGEVSPYIAIFPGVRAPVNDAPVSQVLEAGARDISFQTTVAARSVEALVPLADALEDALLGRRIGVGQIKPQDMLPTGGVMYDDGVKPPRYFEPMFWEITT